MMEFITGALLSLAAVLFLGYLDVRVIGRPQTEPVFGRWELNYAFVCAWELTFVLVGFLAGWGLGK